MPKAKSGMRTMTMIGAAAWIRERSGGGRDAERPVRGVLDPQGRSERRGEESGEVVGEVEHVVALVQEALVAVVARVAAVGGGARLDAAGADGDEGEGPHQAV